MFRVFPLIFLVMLGACGKQPWNDPYPVAERGQNILYSVFNERPKHLDPARSYSSNEVVFTGQIYEPPLQYHYLKRPYELQPLTTTKLPEVRYFNAAGQELPADAEIANIAYSEYRITLRPGIRYQPHPAFAQDAQGKLLYHALTPAQVAAMASPLDLPQQRTTSSRSSAWRIRA